MFFLGVSAATDPPNKSAKGFQKVSRPLASPGSMGIPYTLSGCKSCSERFILFVYMLVCDCCCVLSLFTSCLHHFLSVFYRFFYPFLLAFPGLAWWSISPSSWLPDGSKDPPALLDRVFCLYTVFSVFVIFYLLRPLGSSWDPQGLLGVLLGYL